MIIDYSTNSYTIEDEIIDQVDEQAKFKPSQSLEDIVKDRAREDALTAHKYGRLISAIADIRHNTLKTSDANPRSSFYRTGAKLWPVYCEHLLDETLRLNPTRCLRFTQLPTW